MKNITSLCLLFLASFCFVNCFGQPTFTSINKVVFIRHGEKPDKGDNLSCKGLNRSLQLPAVLNRKFKTFNSVFVPTLSGGRSTKHARMYQTIVPYAVQQNLNINSTYDADDIPGITAAIKKAGGSILLVWEHKNISKIIKALGVKDVIDKWEDNDFDSIWVVTFNNGIGTLTKETESLNPSSSCN
jgi:hypothetical protein